MGDESTLVSAFLLTFTVMNHFITLPFPIMRHFTLLNKRHNE